MLATFLTFVVADVTSSRLGAEISASAAWMLFQVFAVSCLTLAGLWWLSKRKT
jgi:hypothetical protein